MRRMPAFGRYPPCFSTASMHTAPLYTGLDMRSFHIPLAIAMQRRGLSGFGSLAGLDGQQSGPLDHRLEKDECLGKDGGWVVQITRDLWIAQAIRFVPFCAVVTMRHSGVCLGWPSQVRFDVLGKAFASWCVIQLRFFENCVDKVLTFIRYPTKLKGRNAGAFSLPHPASRSIIPTTLLYPFKNVEDTRTTLGDCWTARKRSLVTCLFQTSRTQLPSDPRRKMPRTRDARIGTHMETFFE